MSRILLILVGAALVAAGCAGPAPVAVGMDHPANPDAPGAPVPAASQTRSVDGGLRVEAPGTTSPATQPMGEGAYVCPMHPEVASDDPNARCPKCGMRLVPRGEVQ